MTILTDSAILAAREAGAIVIEPFDRECLGGNSYDVHLGPELVVYVDATLDCKKKHETRLIHIPAQGYWLTPGELYLGSTVEYTESHRHVPYLDGKSSIGRLGISVHSTAGRGDIGFCNHWTFEISCIRPVRVYAGMPIGQLTWHEVAGEVLRPYNGKPGAKYTERDPRPQASAMWRNFGS